MKKYRVLTENDFWETYSLSKAERVFENWKDDYMSEGVVAGESFVELEVSEDDFETTTSIKKVIAVVDEDRHELGTPREEGFDWDYWAKWEEVKETN
ncbi:hypothetical protein [Cytobacillus oceanisediminis]|uniref:Activator of Hsp90 ATPase-like protein n=1 Tax=Cytobacillus oceanisediminis TaxID=665099 RepID=A0ABX3CJV5_9BACI|nr:hypothetical protein [Cytobacillus oceanisediminis]EFV74454.1 hypothetical protein HMPREF1013_05334 [Bacillus sp. 2_A_57_CT2]OHX39216.1 hypothetical protein BBV17_03720 [Cytobacillus oceanisediminis]